MSLVIKAQRYPLRALGFLLLLACLVYMGLRIARP
jgi:hypothetical protein